MQTADTIYSEDDSYSFVECHMIFENKAYSVPLIEGIPFLPSFCSRILRERENACDKCSKQLPSGERLRLTLGT